MTLFDELLTDVYDLTNRADLVNETAIAIKSATLKAHRLDFFSKDIYETGVSFPELTYRQSLDYIALIPNFRAIKYIRAVNSSTDDLGVKIEIITPDEITDSYGLNRNDIAYVAGRVLEIRSSVQFQYMLLGAYVLPIVTTPDYSSWVAEQFKYAIVFEAARLIFKTIGQMEESNGYRQMVAEEYSILTRDGISDVGF